MLTPRLLRVVRSIGVGLSPTEITEFVDTVSLAVQAGVLRLGDYNSKLINNMSLAWTSKPFNGLTAHEYTHGDRHVQWLDSDNFLSKAELSTSFIRLPGGHPVKALYSDGHVSEVFALSFPGEYSIDVTDFFSELFPAGVDKNVTEVYAVVSSSESDWAREVWRTGLLLTGERGFIFGVDKITLAWVEGCDIQEFCDYGVLGAMSLPIVDIGADVHDVVEAVDNSRAVLIGVSDMSRCALYGTRAQIGEVVGIRTSAGACGVDVAYLELDTGDVVSVSDIMAMRGLSEGSEVYYTCGDGSHVLCDEFGNTLLGSTVNLFD